MRPWLVFQASALVLAIAGWCLGALLVDHLPQDRPPGAVITSPIPAAAAGSSSTRTKRKAYIQGLVNGQRATRDHHGLSWNARLADYAQTHAARMANAQRAYHSGRRAEIVGESVGLTAMFASFWRSDDHRPWILCSCSVLGVGVVRRFDIFYVVVEFG